MNFSVALQRCGAALLATAAAFLLCRLAGPALQGPAAYLLLALAVWGSARVGGRGAALAATLLGLVAGFFLRSPGPIGAPEGIAAGLFLLLGAGIAITEPAWDRSFPAAGAKGATVAPPARRRRVSRLRAPVPGGETAAPRPEEAEAVRRERDAERRLRRRLAVLHEVSLQLSALSSRDELCRQAVELGRSRLGFDRIGLWLQLDEPEVILGSFGTDEQGQTRDERHLRLPIHVIPLAAELLDGSARVLRREDALLYGDQGNPVGRGTHLLAGMWDGDRFIGFLAADNLLSGRPLREPDSELLGLYAATLGPLCTRLKAEEALRESWEAERGFHQQLAALHDISLELATAPDLDTLCRRAVELGRARLGFDRLGLWFRTEEPDQVCGSFGTDDTGQTRDEREIRMPVFPGTPTDHVLSGRERVARLENTVLFSLKGEEVRGTQVVAGLWNGQQAIGYLSADNRIRQRPFTEQEPVLLELYAATVGHLCTLKQREEALREADGRKDRSLAMVAHELRNSLAPIQNAIELLHQKLARSAASVTSEEPALVSAPAIRHHLAVIERQARQQSRLLDDLLDLSRIGQGKLELRCSRLDLARLVRDAVEDRRGVLEVAGLSLTLELPDRPVWVEGDATRLAQAVGNLLANAGKFTPPGGEIGVRLVRESVSEELAPEQAVLTVSDTGIGIEPALLPRVFDAFEQADRGRAHSPDGLGLGLALVKGLIERHGGAVSAASDGPGCGARLTITLPILDS